MTEYLNSSDQNFITYINFQYSYWKSHIKTFCQEALNIWHIEWYILFNVTVDVFILVHQVYYYTRL